MSLSVHCKSPRVVKVLCCYNGERNMPSDYDTVIIMKIILF